MTVSATKQTPRHPDLGRMVEHYGGYDKIPEATWREFDRAVAAYRADRRAEYVGFLRGRGKRGADEGKAA